MSVSVIDICRSEVQKVRNSAYSTLGRKDIYTFNEVVESVVDTLNAHYRNNCTADWSENLYKVIYHIRLIQNAVVDLVNAAIVDDQSRYAEIYVTQTTTSYLYPNVAATSVAYVISFFSKKPMATAYAQQHLKYYQYLELLNYCDTYLHL